MTKHGSPHPSFGDTPPAALATARVSLARDHAVLEADAGFAALVGLASDELYGRSIFDFIFPAERQAVADRLSYAVACRHDRVGCLALRRPDDHAVHIDAVLRYETTGGEGLWLHCNRLTGGLVAAAGPVAPSTATPAATPTATPTTDPTFNPTFNPTANSTFNPTATPSAPADVDAAGLDEACRQVLRLEDARGGAMLVVGGAGRVLAGTSAAAMRIGVRVEDLAGQTVDALFAFSQTARELLHDAVGAGCRRTVPASIVGGLALANLEWLPAQRAGYGFLFILPVHMAAGSDEHAQALQQSVRLLWHDAGEAVTALVLGTETLSSLLGADARRPGAAHIASELTRHARLIHQAVAEVRHVENGTPVEFEPVDLGAVITMYVDATRAAAAADSIDIRTEITPNAWVHSTELRVRSIVRNLVTNARQALARQPGGGTIEITTTLADGEVGAGVRLVVRDDGPGMSDALARVIFEPGLSDRDGGTGFGLNLVRAYIVESGGAVQPHTRPGAGTAFVIWLPIVAPGDVAAKD